MPRADKNSVLEALNLPANDFEVVWKHSDRLADDFEVVREHVAAFDKLEDYMQALKFAQSGFQIATQPGDDLQALVEEGGKLRLAAGETELSAEASMTASVG